MSSDLRPHRGGIVLALGILSLVFCALLGPMAWVMANADLADMAAGRMDPEGRSMTDVGKVCGIIGTLLMVPAILVALFFFGVLGTAAVSGGM